MNVFCLLALYYVLKAPVPADVARSVGVWLVIVAEIARGYRARVPARSARAVA